MSPLALNEWASCRPRELGQGSQGQRPHGGAEAVLHRSGREAANLDEVPAKPGVQIGAAVANNL